MGGDDGDEQDVRGNREEGRLGEGDSKQRGERLAGVGPANGSNRRADAGGDGGQSGLFAARCLVSAPDDGGSATAEHCVRYNRLSPVRTRG